MTGCSAETVSPNIATTEKHTCNHHTSVRSTGWKLSRLNTTTQPPPVV